MGSNRNLKPDKSWRVALLASGVALSVPGTIAGPALFGYMLDKRYNSAPTWLSVGLLLGFIVAIFEIIIVVKRMKELQ